MHGHEIDHASTKVSASTECRAAHPIAGRTRTARPSDHAPFPWAHKLRADAPCSRAFELGGGHAALAAYGSTLR
jgi:hypothetical protein